jgi:hypothetical protein
VDNVRAELTQKPAQPRQPAQVNQPRPTDDIHGDPGGPELACHRPLAAENADTDCKRVAWQCPSNQGELLGDAVVAGARKDELDSTHQVPFFG